MSDIDEWEDDNFPDFFTPPSSPPPPLSCVPSLVDLAARSFGARTSSCDFSATPNHLRLRILVASFHYASLPSVLATETLVASISATRLIAAYREAAHESSTLPSLARPLSRSDPVDEEFAADLAICAEMKTLERRENLRWTSVEMQRFLVSAIAIHDPWINESPLRRQSYVAAMACAWPGIRSIAHALYPQPAAAQNLQPTWHIRQRAYRKLYEAELRIQEQMQPQQRPERLPQPPRVAAPPRPRRSRRPPAADRPERPTQGGLPALPGLANHKKVNTISAEADDGEAEARAGDWSDSDSGDDYSWLEGAELPARTATLSLAELLRR
eukprot:TRINITY_DN2780_c0_g1_i1.p1 TRINITY_DN2780_c0_g1~~TRINITY_DN2780_c0_g1_i1.p1  ORF type:complete len:356 (+),score=73.15 TRINITY_DN2780_c0_g1_i1:86-1069(+)